jgi:5'(3')-deoxyribonucleotidase
MDDVIVDLVPAWIKRYNEIYNDNLTNEQIAGWNMVDYVKPECGLKIFDILAEPGFIYGLNPVEGAIESVNHLVELIGIEKVFIVSAAFSQSMREKSLWIEKYLPVLKDNVIFAKKKGALYAPGSFLIDDGVHNIIDFNKAGGSGYIFDTPHNQEETFPEIKDCYRYKGWNDLMSSFEKYAEYINRTSRRIN